MRAVQGHDSAARREGAARLFAGWSFGHKRSEDLRQLPAELRATLLEHTLRDDDEDKHSRARAAFQ